MRRWKYIGCIVLIALAVSGAYFLPQLTSAYTDRRAEGRLYTEKMKAFATEKETVKERSRRVMEGARKTGMIWGEGQDVGKGSFRKRVKKELQQMKKVGLLPDVFSWKWVGKPRYIMTAYYWNLNEDIADFGDLGLWHIAMGCDDMDVELDMDASTYKIYHVSIFDSAKKLDNFTEPKREDWIKGFEAYYEFSPLEAEKKLADKIPLWEDEVYRYKCVNQIAKYNDKLGDWGWGATMNQYLYVEGFSTLVDMRWEIYGGEGDDWKTSSDSN